VIVHGLSHGLAAVWGALGVEIAKQVLVAHWPKVHRTLHEALSQLLMLTHCPVASDRLADWLLIGILGFLWGVGFKALSR